MTKIKISVLGLIAVLFATLSCSKDSNPTESNNAIENKESLLLQKKYNFENLKRNVDKSDVTAFKSSTNLNKLTSKSSSSEENLDLKNVTQINWKNNKTSYLIPFVDNPSKAIVILVDNNNTEKIDFSKGTIVENNINPNTGTGEITLITQDNTIKKAFEDGVMTKYTSKQKSAFRQCFDQAYDDICDGAIGCASWYSSPLPALTAIAYCAATTYEEVHPEPELPKFELEDDTVLPENDTILP